MTAAETEQWARAAGRGAPLMRSTGTRTAAASAAALLTAAALAGCTTPAGQGTPAPSATPSGTAVAAPTPSGGTTSSGVPTPVASASTPSGSASATPVAPVPASSCPAQRRAIPAGAVTTSVRLVDGEQRVQQAYLTTSSPWELGLVAAGGVVVATVRDPLPAGGAHHAWAVDLDGFPGNAIVLDDGLSAAIYTFRDCRIQRLTGTDGTPLSVAIGARSATGDATTGVACNDQNGGVLVEAAQARLRGDGRYDVVWSTLEPAGDGLAGRFTGTDVRYRGLAADDPRVAKARESSCWAATTLTAAHPG